MFASVQGKACALGDLETFKVTLGQSWTSSTGNNKKMDSQIKHFSKMVQLAATTKLEWQLMNALTRVGAEASVAMRVIKDAEKVFSQKYKLMRSENVHQAILEKRKALEEKAKASKKDGRQAEGGDED